MQCKSRTGTIIVFLLFTNVLCFLLLMDPSGYRRCGKISFFTGSEAWNEDSSSSLNPPGEQNHIELIRSVDEEIQNAIKQYSDSASFELRVEHVGECLSRVVYSAQGNDSIDELLDFAIRDMVETRIEMTEDVDFKNARNSSRYSGGYSRKPRETAVTHWAGYVGILSAIIASYCFINRGRSPGSDSHY